VQSSISCTKTKQGFRQKNIFVHIYKLKNEKSGKSTVEPLIECEMMSACIFQW